VVTRDPVDTGDHTRHRAGAPTTEHANPHDPNALGDSIGGPADGAGDVRAVAVAVVGTAAVDGVEARHSASLEMT
jgi:hypothetical protein